MKWRGSITLSWTGLRIRLRYLPIDLLREWLDAKRYLDLLRETWRERKDDEQ